ncbi:MAG: carboxymuconolactone decarboxylase family protein [Rubripirellula sp.]
MTKEKILAIPDYRTSELFDVRERLALEYADRITLSSQDVSHEFFAQLQEQFTPDETVELTATIAWENCSSKFNRALRIPAQGLWECEGESEAGE